MGKVTGLGGVFFKSADPERLYAWYENHLGHKRGENGVATFRWREKDGEKPAPPSGRCSRTTRTISRPAPRRSC